METFFKYKYAVVCRSVPNSVTEGLSLHEHAPINIKNAREDQKVYLKALKDLGLKLIEIDGDERYPDCVFVEDAAIVIGKKILITNPGAESRRGEIVVIKAAIETFVKANPKEGFVVGEIKNKNETFLDGGDCCFTGRELLVGISTRTNKKAIDELTEFFNDTTITTVSVSETLHLKSVLTMASVDTILINTLPAVLKIREEIQNKSKFASNYKFIQVDEEKASSVLFVNNTLFYPSSYKHVYEQLKEFDNVKKLPLPNAEFDKIDGSLSCRSICL